MSSPLVLTTLLCLLGGSVSLAHTDPETALLLAEVNDVADTPGTDSKSPRSIFRQDYGRRYADIYTPGNHQRNHQVGNHQIDYQPPFGARTNPVPKHPLDEHFRELDKAKAVKYAPIYNRYPKLHYKPKYYVYPKYEGQYSKHKDEYAKHKNEYTTYEYGNAKYGQVSTHPKYQKEYPKYDDEHPKYAHQYPEYDDQHPKYAHQYPEYDDQHPKYAHQYPKYDGEHQKSAQEFIRYQDAARPAYTWHGYPTAAAAQLYLDTGDRNYAAATRGLYPAPPPAAYHAFQLPAPLTAHIGPHPEPAPGSYHVTEEYHVLGTHPLSEPHGAPWHRLPAHGAAGRRQRAGKALDRFTFDPEPFIQTIAIAYHENEKNFGGHRQPKHYVPEARDQGYGPLDPNHVLEYVQPHRQSYPAPPLVPEYHVQEHVQEHVLEYAPPRALGYVPPQVAEYAPPHVNEYAAGYGFAHPRAPLTGRSSARHVPPLTVTLAPYRVQVGSLYGLKASASDQSTAVDKTAPTESRADIADFDVSSSNSQL